MRSLFKEYADTLLQAIISIGIFTIFMTVFLSELMVINTKIIKQEISSPNINSGISNVTIKSFSAKDILTNVGQEIKYEDRVEAYNSKDEDIKDYIRPLNLEGIDLSKPGENEITYILNYNGESRAIKAKLIIVQEKEEIVSNEEHV